MRGVDPVIRGGANRVRARAASARRRPRSNVILWHRIHADFLMPSRLGEFARLLETALHADYEVMGIQRFWRERAPSEEGSERRFVLRHDVDTDPGTAAALWQIERGLGIAGSWFFRLSTRDTALMAAIALSNGEVGYHYEELATIAKERRLRTRDEALAALPEARDRFRANLAELRVATGLPLRVAASHGDFANRHVGVPNWTLLADRSFRDEVGIDLEGYDADLLARMPLRSTDTAPPRRWVAEDPLAAIGRGEPVVYALVHPRHWRVARAINARDDVARIIDGVRYRLPRFRLPRRHG